MIANRMMMCGKTKRMRDFTTPVIVVATGDTVSTLHYGRDGRNVFLLSNGWWLAVYSYNTNLYFVVSKNAGATWESLCSIAKNCVSVGIYVKGTKVYVLLDGTYVYFASFDAAIIEKDSVVPYANKYVGSPSYSGQWPQIQIGTDGVLHAAWCHYINSTSFRVCYAKSTDDGATWTNLAGTTGYDQMTENSSSQLYIRLLVSKNKAPIIMAGSSGWSGLYTYQPNGTTWTRTNVFNPGYSNMAQRNICGMVTPDGTMHFLWAHMTPNYTYSDIGHIWSANGTSWYVSDITVQLGGDHDFPTITCDKDSNVYASYKYGSSQFGKKRSGSVWGAEYTVMNGGRYLIYSNSLLEFDSPPAIFEGSSDPYSIKFTGKFMM